MKNLKTKKSVQVLLSAYNGEKYLAPQLDSILAQTGVEVSVLVRDDASTDHTKEILENYAQKHINIRWYSGDNLGVQRSFFELLDMADEGKDYYAFADQDDFWLPEKLLKAVSTLEKEEKNQPLLYGSKVVYASEDLKKQELFSYAVPKEPAFGNALVENICMGCTEVFNRELLELVRAHKASGDTLHDWWMYLTASCFGKVVFDENAYILYRQHAGNQVGMQNNWSARWKKRFIHFKKLRYSLSRQARDFLDRYTVEGECRILALKLADYRSSIKKRIALIREDRIYRQQDLDNKIYHLLFLLGLL